jgi:hypothetical protein
MPFSNIGSNETQRIVFNSGTLDFGYNRLVELDNIALNVEWGINTLYVLNSIKPQDIARHTQKVTLTGKIKSFSAALNSAAYGSSTPGTPNQIDTLDGQPTLLNPVFTIFDRNAKEIQYQLSGALIKKSSVSARAEEYAEFDFELEAKDIALLYTS